MAGLNAHFSTPQIATGTALKTVVQILAPTNQRLLIKEWSVSFEGTSNTASPIQVDIVRQNTAGTGLNAATEVLNNLSDDETIQATVIYGNTSAVNTAEPTAVSTLITELVHPQTGFLKVALLAA